MAARRSRKVLLCPMAEGVGLGPISQLLAVAEEATLKGVECAFLASGRHQGILEQLGYRCYAAPRPIRKDSSAPDYRLSDAARALGIADVEYLTRALEAEQRAIDDFSPDILFSATKLTTVVSARRNSIPLVSLTATPDSPDFTSPLYPPTLEEAEPNPDGIRLQEFFAARGLPGVTDLSALSFKLSDYKVAASCRSFDPFFDPEEVTYVGPLLSKAIDLYWTKASFNYHRPLIVVYINRGSVLVSDYIDILIPIAISMKDHDFLIIEPEASSQLTVPDNVIIVDRIPITRVIQHAVALISGGGKSAVLSAAQAGVPVLGLPGRSAERDFNVRRITDLGGGLMASGFPPAAADVREALDLLIREDRFRQSAAALAVELADLPGASGVVRLLREV